MRRFLYILLQCTWGLPQTLAGAVLWLVFAGSRHFRYREAVATQWPLRGGISLGLFIFVSDTTLCYHEYGHTLQSLILGPLYLPFVGLPSLVWAGCYRLFRIRRSYVSVYPENWAEHLGRPSLRRPSQDPPTTHRPPSTVPTLASHSSPSSLTTSSFLPLPNSSHFLLIFFPLSPLPFLPPLSQFFPGRA